MNQSGNMQKQSANVKKNALESLKDLNNFDNLWDDYSSESNLTSESIKSKEKKQHSTQRKEFTVFNYQMYYEQETVRKQIKELTEMIKKEIEHLKLANKSLLSDIRDIQKLTLNALPEKMGVYHVNFLEIVLSILRSLRAKIGESGAWLQAMTSKRKKRGSLFASLSKKKGTQYSMSQELSSARSVQ